MSSGEAIKATAHKVARIFDTVMRYGVEYQKRSDEEFVIEHRTQMGKNRHRRAKELGYELRSIETPASEQPTAA